MSSLWIKTYSRLRGGHRQKLSPFHTHYIKINEYVDNVNDNYDRISKLIEQDYENDSYIQEKEMGYRCLTTTLRTHILDKINNQKISNNALEHMVFSGSKGKKENLLQIKYMFGQQMYRGNRPDSVLVYYDNISENLVSKGFCINCLSIGLSIPEYFYHSQAARESIVIMGKETPDTGYMQRLLIKFMENIRVSESGIIRHNNGSIIQLSTSVSGIDPMNLYCKNDILNIKKTVNDIIKQRI
ncbi:DNA-directed RNA polymerase III subunit RPC1 [Lobulomyces angularis]|nr:DNA-directed RNA polymerase III subunit RPC1 [Lobulomyces angularis]